MCSVCPSYIEAQECVGEQKARSAHLRGVCPVETHEAAVGITGCESRREASGFLTPLPGALLWEEADYECEVRTGMGHSSSGMSVLSVADLQAQGRCGLQLCKACLAPGSRFFLH